MIWWYWMFLGLALVGAEMMSPGGFYLLFFGIAAVMVGALTGLDVIQADWLQWLLFSIAAILSLLLLRGPLIRLTQRHPPQAMDTMIGETAILIDALQPEQTGKVELRGSTWGARNVGTTSLSAGQRATVIKVDGLMLWVRQK